MANTGKFRYEIGVSVDKSSVENAKTQFRSLMTSLQEIDKQAVLGFSQKDLAGLEQTANKLRQALGQAWNADLGQLNLTKFQQNLVKSELTLTQVKSTLQAIGREGAFNKLANEIIGTNFQLKTTNNLLEKMSITFANTIRYGISSSVFNNLTNSISKAYSYAKNLDKSLNDIRIVSNQSAKDMERFAINANKAAKELGASTLDYTKGALIYYQQGLPTEEVEKRTEVTLKMANVLGASASEVSDYMTAIWNNFAEGSDNLEHFADVVTALGAATASSSEEIATGLEKFAAIAETVGLSYEYAATALATVVAQTRQSADVVGTAFKTIFARMEDLKLGNTLDDGTTLGKYSSALAAVGINIKDQNGELKEMDDILNEMGSKWERLSKDQQVALAQSVAGIRQYTQLIALMDNWSTFQKNLSVAQNSEGTLQQQQEIYMDSLEAHLQKLSTEAERTWDILFDEKGFKSLADIATGVLKQINDMLASMGGGLNTIVTLASQLGVIFSRQIGNEALRIGKNFKESLMGPKEREKLYNDLATNITEQTEEEAGLKYYGDLNKDYVKEQLEYTKEILKVQKGLTEEETNQLITNEKEIALLKQESEYKDKLIKKAKEYSIYTSKDLKERTKDYTENSYQSLADTYGMAASGLGKSGRPSKATLQSLGSFLNIADNINTEQIFALTDQQEEELKQTFENIKENINYTIDQEGKIIVSHINDTNKVAKNMEQYLNLAETQIKNADILKNTSDEDISDINFDILQKQRKREEGLNKGTQGIKAQNITRIGFAAAQGISGLIGTFKVLNDEMATSDEKAKALGQGFISSASAAIGAFNPLAGVLVQIGGQLLESLGIWKMFSNAFKTDSEKAQEKIKTVQESIERLKEQTDLLETMVDDLKSSFDKYLEVKETLELCNFATQEWEDALKDVNDTITEILDKYPELASLEGILNRDPDTGLLSLNEDLYQQYLSQIQNEQIIFQTAMIKMKQEKERLVNDLTKSEIQKNMKSFTYVDTMGGETTYTFDNLGNDEIFNRLLEVADSEEDFRKEASNIAKEFADSNNIQKELIDSIADSFLQYRDEIVKYSKRIEETAISIKNSNKIIASTTLGAGANNVQLKLFEDEYQDVFDTEKEYYIKFINDRVKRSDKKLNEEVLNEINNVMGTNYSRAQEHSNQVIGYDGKEGIWVYDPTQGKDVMYTRDDWAAMMATTSAIESTLNQGIVNKGSKILTDVSKSSGINEKLINKALSDSFNINQLSEEEYMQLFTNRQKIIDALKDSGEKGAVELSESFKKKIESTWDANAYAEYLTQQFNSALSTAATKASENLKLEKEAFEGFGKYLAEISTDPNIAGLADTLEKDGEATAIVTQSIMRMNRGLKTLSEGMEDWIDVLNKSEKSSYEYWEALDKIKDGLSDVLDVEKEYISNKFIEEHLNEITEAATGNEEAIDNLRDAYADAIILDISANLTFDPKSIINSKETLIEEINKLQETIPNLELGAVNDEAFIASLQQIINDTNMTVDEANKMFAGLGFEAEFESDPQETTTEVPVYTTYTRPLSLYKSIKSKAEVGAGWTPSEESMTIQTGTTTLKGQAASYSMGVSTKDGKYTNRPKISKLTKKGTGSFSNYSSLNSGGKGLSSGSSSEPKTVDPIDEQADRYHKVNTQITKVDNSLKKLQSQQNKLVGKNLIDNLISQWEELNQQITNYDDKLKIANDEQNELAQKLSGQGVQFNADGTISNYFEIFQAQEDSVNRLISQYNLLSAAEQEAWDNAKTIDNAKDQFNQFKENLDRYDELVSDFIPQLRQEIQDAIDKQIENQIERFNMEITITLDMNQATRDWNAWAKRAMDGIDPEYILGNAKARLQDFYTYFNTKGSGDLQTQTKHAEDLLKELKQLDETGKSDVYGDDRAKALEDLKTYYQQLMTSITETIELQDELHQAVLDEMDEVQEKFDKQISSYSMLRDMINHDIKIIQLTLGENAYGEMSKFYEMQQQNYEKQLDFQRQQKEFWYAEMQAAEEGSKEWESAREKWENAVKEFNSILEEGLENAKSKFENAINDIFNKLNKSLTGGLGLDYINTQWDLINQNADRYLDTINATYGIRELEKKYIDSINKTDNITAQQKLRKVMDEQLSNLKERDRITQYDLDRANKLYEIELARIALQDAQRNKSQMRLRRDSQGNYRYQYIADNDAISQAENELSNLYNGLYNFDKDRYNTVLNDIYSIWDNYQKAMAEAALINDPELRAEREKLIQEQYNELMMQAEDDYQIAKYNLQESFFQDWVELNDMELEQFNNLTENEKDLIMQELVPTWKNGLSEMADAFAGPQGFAEVTTNAWFEIKNAQQQYMEDTQQLEVISGQTFDSIIAGQDESIIREQMLIKENQDLIESYRTELDAVKDIYDQLKQNISLYQQEYDMAKAATEQMYKYRQEELEVQRLAAANQGSPNTTTTHTNSNYINNSSSVSAISSVGNSISGAAGALGGGIISSITQPAKYTIGLDNGFDKCDIKTVTAGSSISLPALGRSGYIFKGWQIPSLGTVVGGGFNFTPTKDEMLTAQWSLDIAKGIGTIATQTLNIVKGITKFDTGGYTGSWDNSGRLAVLDQKELVLNAQDTENMLNTVAIMRNISNSLGSNTLAKLASISAGNINSTSDEASLLEQNVHIDAQFPNVHNAAEIEQALNNLVNAASQRANLK